MNMRRIFSLILSILLALLALYVLSETIRIEHYIAIGNKLKEEMRPYEQQPINASMHILVVGDSTGYGTGASSPEHSLAGLLGKKYPLAAITNVSVNGAKTADVIDQLKNVEGTFDLIMIHAGGNDAVHFTPTAQLRSSLHSVIDLALTKGRYVLITSTGNVDTVPLFPWPTRFFFGLSSEKTRAVFLDVVSTYQPNVRYTDLYRMRAEDLFATEPKTYYAADHFHPSDLGYAYWFKLIAKELDQFPLPKAALSPPFASS